jgi:2-hydroxychromene-2-carboxylate isomerase
MLEYWFDFASTYSYLTTMRIEEACAKRSIQIAWRPFLLGPLFKEQGWSTSPFNVYPAEGNYMWREMERHSRKYGLTQYRRPTGFPRNSLLAARIAVAAKDEPWLGQFIKKVFRLNFEQDKDISDRTHLIELLRKLGINADHWVSMADTDAVKMALRQRTEQARAWGIFGAPSFIAKNELFWGDDRLEEACDELNSSLK